MARGMINYTPIGLLKNKVMIQCYKILVAVVKSYVAIFSLPGLH